MRRSVLGLAVTLACTRSEPAPTIITADVPVEDTPAAVIPAATPTPVVPAADAGAANEIEDMPAAPPSFDPALAPAIWPDAPDAVEIVHVVSHRGERVVLYRFLGAVAWREDRRRAGTLAHDEAQLADTIARCEDADDIDDNETALCECELFAAPDPFVAVSEPRWGSRPFVWELARIARVDGELRVAERKRLSDLSLDDGGGSVEVKLSAADLDADGRPELTVVVPFATVECDVFTEHNGALGYLLAWTDLRELLAVTRQDVNDYSHAEGSREELESRWLVKELTGDGHPDLRIRTTTRRESGDEDGTSERGGKTIVCAYDPAVDGWPCPEQPPKPVWSPHGTGAPDCGELRLGSFARCKTAPPPPRADLDE